MAPNIRQYVKFNFLQWIGKARQIPGEAATEAQYSKAGKICSGTLATCKQKKESTIVDSSLLS